MEGILPPPQAPTGVASGSARWRAALTAGQPFALRRHAAPLALTVALVVGTLAWNARVGLIMRPSPLLAFASSTAFFVVAAVYARFRLAPLVAELAFYFGLWLSFPAFAAVLSYLCMNIGLPLRDQALEAADAALGFDWSSWYGVELGHPLLLGVQARAYFSLVWQALLSISILAVWRQGHRNGELLTGMLVGVLITLLVATLVPAVGPGAIHGHPPEWLPTFLAVRSGAPGVLGYAGIISFPSFHTVMAILFVWAHRGLRWSFPPFLIVNLLLLSATPFLGSHYLIDMLAGAVVALLAILIARRLCPADPACTANVRAA